MGNRLTIRSGQHLNVVTSQIRSQIVVLKTLLESIEGTRHYENDYVEESLKTVHQEINRLRRFVQTE